MNKHGLLPRTSPRGVLVCGLAVMAGLAVSSTALGVGDDRASGDGVVRIRRGESSGGSGVQATRRAAPARPLAPSGGIEPESGAGPDGGPEAGGALTTLEDPDSEGAGLPDAEVGEAPTAAPAEEVFQVAELGIRGKRNGRMVSIQGAEFVFCDAAIDVESGLAIGYTGVRGSLSSAPGAAYFVEFELERGGEVVLTVQPRSSGPAGAPLRPVHTVTMQVP